MRTNADKQFTGGERTEPNGRAVAQALPLDSTGEAVRAVMDRTPTPAEFLRAFANIEEAKALLMGKGFTKEELYISTASVPKGAQSQYGEVISALFLRSDPPVQLTYQSWHGVRGLGKLQTLLTVDAINALQDRDVF